MTGISDQFRRNFEQSTVMTPADKDKAEEGAKGKGTGGSSAGGVGAEQSTGVGSTDQSGVVSYGDEPGNVNLSALYLDCMMTSYNTQAVDLENRSTTMDAENEEAAQISDAEAAVTGAYLANGGGDVTIQTSTTGEAYSDSSGNAYLTPEQIKLCDNNGLTITPPEKVSASDVQSLTSTMDQMESSYSGNSEETLLYMQMDTQNLQQDASLATSGLKSIGDAQSEAARNV